MRPRSMTGFGRGKATDGEKSWTVEVRTVNHRYLDQKIILPRVLSGLEEQVRKTVSSYQERGRVEVTLVADGQGENSQLLTVDMNLARQYHDCLLQLGEEFGLVPRIQLSDMLKQRDIITR